MLLNISEKESKSAHVRASCVLVLMTNYSLKPKCGISLGAHPHRNIENAVCVHNGVLLATKNKVMSLMGKMDAKCNKLDS